MTQPDQFESAQAPTVAELAEAYGYMTPGYIKVMESIHEKHQQWVREYMGKPWTDGFLKGEECEYQDSRGEWIPARVLDLSIEDRLFYVIEYVNHLGVLRGGKATSGELRKRSIPIG